jgi:hypothetical protein
MGPMPKALTTALVGELQCSELGNHEMAARRRYVHLVAPPFQIENNHDHGSFTMTTQNSNCQLGSDYSCERIWTYWPHLTTEDFPVLQGGSISNFMASFQLSIYKIGCHWDHDLRDNHIANLFVDVVTIRIHQHVHVQTLPTLRRLAARNMVYCRGNK